MISFITITLVSVILLSTFCYYFPYYPVEKPQILHILFPILVIAASTTGVWIFDGAIWGIVTLLIGVATWYIGITRISLRRHMAQGSDIASELMRKVVELEVDKRSLSSPEITDYLKGKHKISLEFAIAACDGWISSPSSIINPQVFHKVRGVLRQEVARRG